MSSRQGSGRRAARRWKAKKNAGGDMRSAIQGEESQHHPADRSNRSPYAGQTAGRNTRAITLAEAAMAHTPSTDIVLYITPTFHTIAKDGMIPFPFEAIPHLQVTGRYSKSKLLQNELVFYYIFEPGQYATREVLQLCRTTTAKTVKDRLGFALIKDHVGDPIIVVTKKTGGPQGTCTLTGDKRIRFPSARSAKHAYEQHRGRNHRGMDTSRPLTHNGIVSPAIIPTWHMGEESNDPSLQKIFISCANFKGKDNIILQSFLHENLA